MSNSDALKYARLVEIAASTESEYGQPQWDAAGALGYQITQSIWGEAFGEKATFGFVARFIGGGDDIEDNETVVAFRGTDPKRLLEWIEDADCELVPWGNGGKVHRGFKAVFDSLDWQVAGFPVICGHSLGGALATLLADRLESTSVYTFGSPRVGDMEFVMSHEDWANTFRYVNRYDPMPHAPPRSLGYEHVGAEIRLSGPFEMDLAKNHELATYLRLL